MERPSYTKDDHEFIDSIKWSIYRALWGEVIPSMRGIIIKWKPGDKKAWIYFYHQGEITEDIESHYSSIMCEVDADYWGRDIRADYEVIRCDSPEKVPLEAFIVYLRKEPFIDPF